MRVPRGARASASRATAAGTRRDSGSTGSADALDRSGSAFTAARALTADDMFARARHRGCPVCAMTVRLASLLVCCVLACTPTHPRFAFNLPEQRGRLDANGLRFVIMPDPSTQLAEVDVRYEVGSREDPPGKAGLAHLVEHLMFQHKPDGPNTKPLFHFLLQASVFVNAYTNW